MRKTLAAAMAGAIIAVVCAAPASAYTDYPGVVWPGWHYVTTGRYYKEYVYYGGGGSFQICAQSQNHSTGHIKYDCGRVGNVPSPQARLLHCGGYLADWQVKNGDNNSHNMTVRFFENPC